MVTTETHQSQDLLVPSQNMDQDQVDPENQQEEDPASPSSLMAGLDPEKMSQGPVNAITVLTLLDKLVNMLDAVQENQHKMEVHQVEMEGVVKGIQADMTKLSKSQSFTSNTVSKLLDKSRKLSVTMKEMERQGMQVKKLEANHAHLINRNNFKVLIFQEENEIPSTVFVKDPPPYPRDEILEEGEEVEPGSVDGNRSQEGGLQTIDLSSDEDVGLEAEVEDEESWPQDLENMEKSRAEKLKRSSLKKVDSLKKAFSRQNIEKKMTKIGTKIVSAEQREKIKQKTASLKVSPLSFHMRKPRSNSESQLPEASAPTGETLITEAEIQLSPLGSTEQEVSFTEVHAQLAPTEQQQEEEEKEGAKEQEKEEEKEEEKEVVKEQQTSVVVEADVSVVSEGVGEEYALSSTLSQEEKGEEEKVNES
uniref:Caveolae associated protein 2b n=1 Tax=Oreochromis aureus TaxID=47969 RepID=A0AAZ1WVJ5_OREAU